MKGSLEDRLWSKVDKTADCWLWTGATNGRGYGSFRSSTGDNRPAHVVAYELIVGPVPAGLELDHLCRKTLCVRPSHLEPVTHSENVRRGQAPAYWRSKTHCPNGHAYDEANTYVNPSGSRSCRQCRLDANRRWRERRRCAV